MRHFQFAATLMTLCDWREEPIHKSHKRDDFDCGDPDLNHFLKHHARQNHMRGESKTFLALNSKTSDTLLGYYSLAPASVAFTRVPKHMQHGRGRYDIAGFRLARLAVAVTVQGQGLGAQLLAAAARRCILAAHQVGGTVMVIDAKTPRAAQWYAGFGALMLNDAPHTLLLPLAPLAAELAAAGKL